MVSTFCISYQEEERMAYPVVANIIRTLHLLMFVVVLAGPFLPYRFLPYYLLFVWLIFLDWNDWDGVCILTNLERYARDGRWSTLSPLEGGPEFVRPMLQSVGIHGTRLQVDRGINFIFLLCWGSAFIRYVWFSKR